MGRDNDQSCPPNSSPTPAADCIAGADAVVPGTQANTRQITGTWSHVLPDCSIKKATLGGRTYSAHFKTSGGFRAKGKNKYRRVCTCDPGFHAETSTACTGTACIAICCEKSRGDLPRKCSFCVVSLFKLTQHPHFIFRYQWQCR